MRQDVAAAIRRAAAEEGIDPNYALAVAQRESNFDPNAHASKTIHGIFQMTGGLRDKWGAGDSSDPYTQAKAWMRYMHGEVQPAMRNVLGRDPTDAEGYLGHHFGPGRAARMIGHYDPATPVDEIFTPYERSLNPHFDKAGTSSNLMSSITNDIGRRTAKFGGGGTEYASADNGMLDFSQFGSPVKQDADYTDKFNTPLTSDEQAQFDKRFNKRDLYDYDMQGWFKANKNTPMGEGQHFPDTFKKPNHPTFSTESQYHGGEYEGGKWDQKQDGSYTFAPGRTNLEMHEPDELKDYFNRVEPGNKLDLPPSGNSRGLDFSKFGTPVAFNFYDPNIAEHSENPPGMSRPNPRDRAGDEGIAKPPASLPTSPIDPGMERDPASVPKAPLQQVPEEEIDPDRPNFYKKQRQAALSGQTPFDFSQFGIPADLGQGQQPAAAT